VITSEQLRGSVPGTGNGNIAMYLPVLNDLLPLYEVNTPARIAGFIAQIAVESGKLARTVENLNYSSIGLARVFSRHFTVEEFATFAGQPERIANRVYANRLGNGPEESGDGWRYRGRGLIQVTGKGNYQAYSRDTYKDDRCVLHPDTLADPYDAVRSALWYWKKNNLNALADTRDIRQMSLRVNGGLNGYEDRRYYYEKACSEFLVEGK
jgi:putative chitinase